MKQGKGNPDGVLCFPCQSCFGQRLTVYLSTWTLNAFKSIEYIGVHQRTYEGSFGVLLAVGNEVVYLLVDQRQTFQLLYYGTRKLSINDASSGHVP